MATDRKPWKKNLFESLGYEDNYTDPSFLRDLQTNLNVKTFTFREAVRGATFLSNQISSIAFFLIIFYSLYANIVSPAEIMCSSCVITLLGYAFYKGSKPHLNDILEDSKSLLTVLVFGYIFSPLLYTLTDAISTDTIFSMTFFVMFLNLVFFDYGLEAALVSKAISLNAAVFGSICLASRLASSFHAFVLLVVSAIIFVLYPILARRFWSPYAMLPIAMICSFCLYFISLPLMYTYCVILVFINLVCPLTFVRQQNYKNNIHGPWDEAVVNDCGVVDESL